MKISQKITIGTEIIRKRISSEVSPFLVSWALTNRCNYKCKYCDIWKTKFEELDTKQILFIIDELSRCGNRAIAFTGGEPLIRDDIGEIIDYCFTKNIYTKLTTNGSFVKDKINSLNKIGMVRLSLDGPKEIHDAHRQPESYDQVIHAVKLLRENGIKVALNCVISKLNLPYIISILKEAEHLNVRVFFQPLEYRNNEYFLVSNTPNEKEYKEVFAFLIVEKKRGNKYIGNSLSALHYLYTWPYSTIKCLAGFLFWRITSDGVITGCDRFKNTNNSYNCLKGNLKNALRTLPPISCSSGCLRNYTIELNYLLSFNLDSILNLKNDF